jgi:DNA-binding transcriptional regulator YiaG
MSKRQKSTPFQTQMRQSMADLQSIMKQRQSPTGNGRFTIRTLQVTQPSVYNAKSVRRTRQTLQVSQAVFAELLGVSTALVRAWELGNRTPSSLARRLLDQIHANPSIFNKLVQPITLPPTRRRVA